MKKPTLKELKKRPGLWADKTGNNIGCVFPDGSWYWLSYFNQWEKSIYSAEDWINPKDEIFKCEFLGYL